MSLPESRHNMSIVCRYNSEGMYLMYNCIGMATKTDVIVSTNPGDNYSLLGKVQVSTEKQIIAAVANAKKAAVIWKNLGVAGRHGYIEKIITAIAERKDEIAQLVTQEMGMPITQSLLDVDGACEYATWYMNNCATYLAPEISHTDAKSVVHTVYYEPIGVIAVITPWNFPISNFVWGVIQNLVVGNTVVFKHSEEVVLFGKLLDEIMDSCKLPDGVFNQVYGGGSVGDTLVHQDIDGIWFTGSTKIGKYLYQVGAEKFIKVLLELGGSAPGVIFEDADVDSVLESIYGAKFTNCGQVCDGLKRLIVHESRLTEVVEKMKNLIEKKTVGKPDDGKTDIGPLVAQRQLDLLKDQYDDALAKGACVVTGGKEPKGLQGAYFEPTLLTNITKDMKVWKEEVFGPVLPIISFSTFEEAIDLANDTVYGLGSYVFTKDTKKAQEFAMRIQAGMVSTNNAYYLTPSSPFGGYKMSGLGREHGKYGFHELTQVKVVASEK